MKRGESIELVAEKIFTLLFCFNRDLLQKDLTDRFFSNLIQSGFFLYSALDIRMLSLDFSHLYRTIRVYPSTVLIFTFAP